MKQKLEEIARQDGRYQLQALKFVYDGLGHTLKKMGSEPQHITGELLCDGLRELAQEKWGRLAALVLKSWNVRTTRDLGEIVYLMIDHKWMSAQSTDSIEDFDDVFDFDSTFKAKYIF